MKGHAFRVIRLNLHLDRLNYWSKKRWTPSFGQVFVTAEVESGVMLQATLG